MRTMVIATTVCLCVVGMSFGKDAEAVAERQYTNIPAQGLGPALQTFAQQRQFQLVYLSDRVERIETKGVVGNLTADEALVQLLSGTGLKFGYLDERTITVSTDTGEVDQGLPSGAVSALADALETSASALSETSATTQVRVAQTEPVRVEKATAASAETRDRSELETVVVTGTHIRGVHPDSSPVTIYDSDAIRRTGVATVEQFIARLPQNLASLSANGVGSRSQQFNADYAANGIDLRGLGVGTTLVLLNGRRLALSSDARTPDLSLLPLGAIKRIEVLTDGASALYGSDAVGGVVNFILRDDFEGAETVAGYGSVTSGDHDQTNFEQTFGHHWESGRGLFNYSYYDSSALDASDRDFSQNAGPPYTLIPDDRRHNVLVTVEQQFAGGYGVFADVLYSLRDTKNAMLSRDISTGAPVEQQTIRNEHEQYFANIGGRKDLTDTIRLEVLASYSALTSDTITTLDQTTPLERDLPRGTDSSTMDVTAKIDGDLFDVRAGAVKFSLGAGYADDEFEQTVDNIGTPDFHTESSRSTFYAFGEVFWPIVGPDQSIPGMRRLELSLAARHTDYSDFGSELSPKIGLLWAPHDAVKIRGTYGESFRAAFLSQVDATTTPFVFFTPPDFGLPDHWGTPTDPAVVLFALGGGNPELGPEESKTYTAGFDFEPGAVPGLRVSATYFDTQYEDRIAIGDPSGFSVLLFPDLFPELVLLNPTAADVAAILAGRNTLNTIPGVDMTDPEAVAAATDVLIDNRLRNLAISKINGIDLAINYTTDGSNGSYSVGVEGTYLFESEQKITVSSPTITLVDTLFNPPDLRARAFGGFTRGGFGAQLNINYLDDYVNPFAAAGATDVDSWTTLDLSTSYQFQRASGFLRDMRVSLNVQNLLDEDPPFVTLGAIDNTGLNEPIGYDPVNASPVGRFVTLQVSKAW